jgi:RimJ/RimL family protein N-acetyltransferase
MGLLLRPVNRHEDLELILSWRSNPLIYNNFKIQNKPLTWDEHFEYWFNISGIRSDFIILFEFRRVGVFSIKEVSPTSAELSIMIGEIGLWGQGLGKLTLLIALKLEVINKYDFLIASVKSNNIASIKLFTGNGFEFESEFESNGIIWNRYSLKRAKDLNQR